MGIIPRPPNVADLRELFDTWPTSGMEAAIAILLKDRIGCGGIDGGMSHWDFSEVDAHVTR
jgi:hypothetical protein